jgi:hypothetical protein
MEMFQETATPWDLRCCPPPLCLGDRLSIFLLLGTVIVAAAKFLGVLQLARAFHRDNSPDTGRYETRLKHSARNMLQWIFVPFFAWGFLAAQHLYQMSIGLVADKNLSKTVPLFTFGEIFPELAMAIFVSFLIFLCRWFVLKRLEKVE